MDDRRPDFVTVKQFRPISIPFSRFDTILGVSRTDKRTSVAEVTAGVELP